jgi:hypothetical protein
VATLQLVIVCATVLWLTALVTGRPKSRPADVFAGLAVGDRVAAYTDGDQSIQGIVAAPVNGQLLLREAQLFTAGSQTGLGDVRLVSDNVRLLQVLGRGS